MNHERFVQILDAYGASSAHWPDDERTAAAALLAAPGAEGEVAQAALLRAEVLDAALDSYTVALPEADFLRRIEASALAPVQAPLRAKDSGRSLNWRGLRQWFSGGKMIGAGLLGAGAVGLATGLLTISLLAPASFGAGSSTASDEPVYGGTVFSSTSSDWSEQ